jgi:hypothetical protein
MIVRSTGRGVAWAESLGVLMAGVKITARHLGTVRKGKFIPDSPQTFRMEFYKREGKRVSVTVSGERKHKTDPQRKYYFGVVVAIMADYTGYTSDEMHEALKWQFLRVPGANGLLDRVRSTESLTTAEAEEYYEAIRRWAAVEHGVYIPMPGEIEI